MGKCAGRGSRAIAETLRGLAAALLVLGGVATAAAPQRCARVVAVGDLHGGAQAFEEILRATALIDDKGRWTGGQACLVQLGDVVDRGAGSRAILDRLMALEKQAPDHVFPLLGNHEAMNIIGDLHYTDPAEIHTFAADESEGQRPELLRKLVGDEGLSDRRLSRELKELRRRPPGFLAHRLAFSPEGRYGSWLLEHDAVLLLDHTLLVHGGLDAATAQRGVSAINEEVRQAIRGHVEAWRFLVKRGWLDPIETYREGLVTLGNRLWRARGRPGHEIEAQRIRDYFALRDAAHLSESGPLWNRELARAPDDRLEPEVEAILGALDADRIVVAHTPQRTGHIQSRLGGRVFLIDTGAGPAYGGHVSALEIGIDGAVSAVYPDREELLAPPRSDEVVEHFLSEGHVVQSKPVGSGITRPERLVLELDGRRRRAIFKTIDREEEGYVRVEGLPQPELKLADSFRFERAAYVLDRYLGIGLVPVTVLRTVEGKTGSVGAWIEHAIDEKGLREKGLHIPNGVEIGQELAVMRVFDALIGNLDRNLGNRLYTTGRRFQLHLIDHSRTFSLRRELPDAFLARPASLPRELLERLRELDETRLSELLKGLVDHDRRQALLARRDALVQKVESDLLRYGAEVIYHTPAGTTPSALGPGSSGPAAAVVEEP